MKDEDEKIKKEDVKEIEYYEGPGVPPPEKKRHWFIRLLSFISL